MTDRPDDATDSPNEPGKTVDHDMEALPETSVAPDGTTMTEPPPVDVDDRDDVAGLDTPDIIALPDADHGDPWESATDDSEPVAVADSAPDPHDESGVQHTSEPSDYEGWSGDPVLDTDFERADDPPILEPPIVNTDSTPGPEPDPLIFEEPANQATTDDDSVRGDSSTGQAPDSGIGEPAAGGGFLAGLKGRFRRSDQEAGRGDAAGPVTPAETGPSLQDRLSGALRTYFDPRVHVFTTVPHRQVLGVGAVLVLLALLVNSGGAALIVLSAIVPLLILITLTQHDVFEKESNLIVAGVAVAGAGGGVLISALASWIQGEQWFDTGKLNFGAAGFSGQFGEAAGSAPIVVWLLGGVLFPLVGVAAIGGAPVAMQRFPQFRNEAMDAVILGGAMAAGYSIGTTITYWWPMVGDAGPGTSVQDWTLRIFGVGLVRTAIMTLSGALIGFGVWRYLTKQSTMDVGFPAAGGLLGILFLSFGSIALQPSGIWAESLATLVILLLVFAVYRTSLNQAIAVDRQSLGDATSRIICPACHRVTPAGAYCAHCGQPLTIGEESPESP